MLRVKHRGKVVAEIPVKYLAEETPVYNRPTKKPSYIDELQGFDPQTIEKPRDLKETFLRLLSCPNIASKRFIWRQYDHMVQTNTVVLPGSDAAVIRVKGNRKGIAISCDCNSRYCYLDPKEGAKQAVAEAARNVACSGATPRAITDCLNFGNPEKPEVMWQFAEAVEGIAEACRVLETPVTGGNVSFYNETLGKGVWPTPTIGMVGIIDDVRNRLTQFFPCEGLLIMLVGTPKGEVGGSEYLHLIHGKVAGTPPKVELSYEKSLHRALVELAQKQLILSAHDVSLGGIVVALAKCCLDYEKPIGAEVELDYEIRDDFLLFGEDQGLVILSLREESEGEVSKVLERYGLPYRLVGRTTKEGFTIKTPKATLEAGLDEMWEAYNSLNFRFDPQMRRRPRS